MSAGASSRIIFVEAELAFVHKAREALSTRLLDLQNSIRVEFPNGWVPSDLNHAQNCVRNLEENLSMSYRAGQPLPTEIPTQYLPLLRLAIEEHLERLVLAPTSPPLQ